MAKKLYVDTEAGRLVEGVNSRLSASLNSFFENDSAPYELYFLKAAAVGGTTVYEPLDYSSATVRLHIGPNPPSTATAYVAQSIWTNLATTVAATASRVVTGGTSANEQQLITFSPEAFEGTFAITIPARTVTINSAITGGVFTTSGTHGLALLEPFVPSVTTPSGFTNSTTLFVASILGANRFLAADTPTTSAMTAFSSAGGGSLTTLTASTGLLAARSTSEQVASALSSLPSIGVNNISVAARPGVSYRLGYQGEKSQTQLPIVAIAASATPVYGKAATLNFATTQLANAISASASIDATMEIELTESGSVDTVLQVPITLRNDIITSTSPTPLPTITPASSFNLIAPDTSVWNVTIDNSGVLSVTKQ